AVGIFICFIMLQFGLLYQGFQNRTLMGKDFMHVRNAFELAQIQKTSVVLLLVNNIDPDLRSFYELTLRWYGEQYSVPHQLIERKQENCSQIFIENKRAIFIKAKWLEIFCAPTALIQVLEY